MDETLLVRQIKIYTPMMTSTEKEAFYSQFWKIMAGVPASGKIVLFGHFNVIVENDYFT